MYQACCPSGIVPDDKIYTHLNIAKNLNACSVCTTTSTVTNLNVRDGIVDDMLADDVVVNNSLVVCKDALPGTILVSDGQGEMKCFQPTSAVPGDVLTFTGTGVEWTPPFTGAPAMRLYKDATAAVSDWQLIDSHDVPTRVHFDIVDPTPPYNYNRAYFPPTVEGVVFDLPDTSTISILKPGTYLITANMLVRDDNAVAHNSTAYAYLEIDSSIVGASSSVTSTSSATNYYTTMSINYLYTAPDTVNVSSPAQLSLWGVMNQNVSTPASPGLFYPLKIIQSTMTIVKFA